LPAHASAYNVNGETRSTLAAGTTVPPSLDEPPAVALSHATRAAVTAE